MVLGAGILSAQNNLTVNVTNLKANKGTLEIGLFNKEAGFLKSGNQYILKKVKVMGNSMKYTFSNLPSGNYAVAVYQDENADNKCNTNLLGIPTEGYGFSNNFRPKLSAPKFNQTKIPLFGDRNITIQLIR